jgi:hypothetical protein
MSNSNYQGKIISYYRTPEHRAMRSELIRRWKPWEKSTGPKSPEGKAIAAKRGFKGGARGMLRELARILREQDEALKQVP